ncbi:50S ribosomal protein L29 [Candidatus Mycoplasma haematohominis]|uniref:50S ribosomal protein L29 n=1 Tax=Candidatus Mycoplasma haematohominis TaxID=1494318 RepID=UPI001FECE264|nr:50S ribosomal protein L29 [Candidatus Mycoplasma haemohominis]
MITKELRSYDTQKIKSMVIQLKASILENRFKLAQGEITNTGIFKQSRKVIAQLLTILQERGEKISFKDWKAYSDSVKEKSDKK